MEIIQGTDNPDIINGTPLSDEIHADGGDVLTNLPEGNFSIAAGENLSGIFVGA